MLYTRGGDRQQLQVEAMHGGTLLQQRDRLFAIGRVVVDQRDLLALELVQTTFFCSDGLHQRVRRQPIGASQREVPLEHGAILALAAAVAGGDQRNLVARGLFGQGKGDAGGQGLEHGGATVFILQALVALDAAGGVVAGLALFVQDLDAIDATLGINQLQVVGIAIGPGHAVGRIGAGAVGQAGEKLQFGVGFGRRCRLGRSGGLSRRGLCNSHRRHCGERQSSKKS